MGCTKSKPMNTVKYEVKVKTNNGYKEGSSNGDIHIDMIGSVNGTATGWLKLDNLLRNDFQRGDTDEFHLKAKDIGLPLIIRLDLRDRVGKDFWACDEVTVTYQGMVEAHFPVYDWIEDDMWFTGGKALTYTRTLNDAAVKSMRSREIEQSKVRFEWVPRPCQEDVGWGLPRYVGNGKRPETVRGSGLPKVFQPTDERNDNLLERGFEALINAALSSITSDFDKVEDLEDYKKLYRFMHEDEDPPFMNRWKTDVEFGRQQIIGLTPTVLSRCKKLPQKCKISDSHVQELLSSGHSLAQEMESGRIYIADFSEVFQGVKRNKNSKGEQLYCPDAIGLFYANHAGDFLPIAIQLIPDDEESIFTPKDSEDDWLLAKMYYRAALGNLHEWYYHFLLTHNLMEPFAVSMFRCLSRSHPIYKLLRPHLQTVSNINTLARESLIKEGTQANKALAIEGIDMARHMFKTFKLRDLNIPAVLKERGLDDNEILPQNYFSDDALKLWQIVRQFVADVVMYYYHTDQEVAADMELQDFASDVANEGLGWQDHDTKEMPENFSTQKDLIELLTTVIYTSSVSHAAVNFPQYETYKFIPNAPVAMRLPPHRRGEATMDRIMNSLPNVEMSVTTITIAFALSSYSPDEVYLGHYPMGLFKEPEVLAMMTTFRHELETLSTSIRQRNELAGTNAYHWLLPEKIPNSIAV